MSSIAHCLCGAVRLSFDRTRVSSPDICHCESCRRATASPLTAGFTLQDTAWRWTGAAPASYASSPGVTRQFCGTCGTQMAYRTDALPGETHFYIATLTDPASMAPETQAFADEALPWVGRMLSLPRAD